MSCFCEVPGLRRDVVTLDIGVLRAAVGRHALCEDIRDRLAGVLAQDLYLFLGLVGVDSVPVVVDHLLEDMGSDEITAVRDRTDGGQLLERSRLECLTERIDSKLGRVHFGLIVIDSVDLARRSTPVLPV